MSALAIWLHGSGGCDADFSSVLGLMMHNSNKDDNTIKDDNDDVVKDGIKVGVKNAHVSCVVPSLPIGSSPEEICKIVVDSLPPHLPHNTPVFIVAHSYGCCIARLLVDHLHKHYPQLTVRGILLLSPVWSVSIFRLFLACITPIFILDLLRRMDRKGGVNSRSVKRVCGSSASPEVRLEQFKRNQNVQTSTLKCVAYYLLRSVLWKHDLLYGKELVQYLSSLSTVIVVTGDEDHLTPLDESAYKELKSTVQFLSLPKTGHMVTMEQPELVYRALMTLMDQHSSKIVEEKWNLKNYTKWIATPPFSHPITISSSLFEGQRILFGMKVMRQHDLTHSPETLHRHNPKIGLVVDISKDTPPYDTAMVPYKKVATASKIPPSEQNVRAFIQVLDAFWKTSQDSIAVHCHYGFNRTGFMICCYLIERMHLSPDEALKLWAQSRHPGIKHVYFCEELKKRYPLPALENVGGSEKGKNKID